MAQNDIYDEEIVAFESEAEKIIQYLTKGTNDLDVVPIVGMGGQGKTTLARKVYSSKSIIARFDVRAWCIISQTYNRRELLQEILSQVTGSKAKGDKDDILADELKKSLMRKRYLIVLDDMWDVAAWEDLVLSFPNDESRSRIVVTTRLEEVAKQIKHHIDPYFLPFLTVDDSCTLLQKKVFQEENFPPELQNVSLKIAEKCKGLPLVVILVAGIIKRNKTEPSWWHEVKTSLLSYLGESEGYALSTIQLSYDNLSEYLKPCLLYMGMFPEDARIPVSKLISLWIAEGFVQNIESAENYLMDLISSNVVMVSKRGYNGKVKYCQVHDVVLHFCLKKSREEKFMLAVSGRFQSSHWEGSRLSFSFNNDGGFSSWNLFHQCSKMISKFASLGFKTQKPFHQHLRSLITTNTNAGRFSNWNFFRKVSKMRLLKVLDLSSHSVSSLSLATFQQLIHLKYLAVYTKKFHFSPQLHLPHLETLIVEIPGYSKCILIPAIFWKMEKLRHVHFIGGTIFYFRQRMSAESSKLEKLRILRGVEFDLRYEDGISFVKDVLLRRIPNIQQLDFVLSGDYKNKYCLELECLTQLQSLSLDCYKLRLHLPSNLKKLVLRTNPYEIQMSLIAGLPSLEHLKVDLSVHDYLFTLCFGDLTFCKLKLLELVAFHISRWDAREESFPLLETLVIKRGNSLKEIPLSFADIPTLKQIKLIRCNKSLMASAKKIKKDVEDIEGCDRIHLIIREF